MKNILALNLLLIISFKASAYDQTCANGGLRIQRNNDNKFFNLTVYDYHFIRELLSSLTLIRDQLTSIKVVSTVQVLV